MYESYWHAIDYETMSRATVLARENFESVDRRLRSLDMEDVLYIG